MLCPYKTNGQRLEDDKGLYYYGARWSPGKTPGTGDPAAGRFIQADTIIPQQQGVQAWDRYAYTNNNPIRYIDPNGHSYCGSKYADPEVCAEIDPDGDHKAPWPYPWNENLLDTTSSGSQDYQGSGRHEGVDYSVEPGNNVYSSTVGNVVVANPCHLENCVRPVNPIPWMVNGGYGNIIIIEYNAQYLPSSYRLDLGIKDGQSVYVAYAHLSEINVSVGDSVTANQLIGLSGNTGNSTGPHLHVEVRVGSSESIIPGSFCTPINQCWGNDNWVEWRKLTLVDPDILFPEPNWNKE